MPLSLSAAEPPEAAPHLRRIAAFAAALAALLLWLVFLPALLDRQTLTPLGGGCWLRGYRDPVTGRSRSLAGRELRQTEACSGRFEEARP